MSVPSSTPGRSDPGAEPDFPPLRVLPVEGADAASFLQGQLTCDVAALALGAWSWFGYCTPAGRLLVTGRLARWEAGFLVQVPAPLVDEFVQRLRRFVLRARVSIQPAWAPSGYALAAADLPGGEPPLPPPHSIQVQGGALRIGVAPGLAMAHPMADTAAPAQSSAAATAALRLAEVRAGAPWVLPVTREAFIPQMLGLDTAGGVSFTKGCYPGQEIVARARYRGTVKRGPYLATARTALAPGTALGSARFGTQQAGVVVQSAADGPAWLVHAVIEHSAAREPISVQGSGEPLSDVRALHEAP